MAAPRTPAILRARDARRPHEPCWRLRKLRRLNGLRRRHELRRLDGLRRPEADWSPLTPRGFWRRHWLRRCQRLRRRQGFRRPNAQGIGRITEEDSPRYRSMGPAPSPISITRRLNNPGHRRLTQRRGEVCSLSLHAHAPCTRSRKTRAILNLHSTHHNNEAEGVRATILLLQAGTPWRRPILMGVFGGRLYRAPRGRIPPRGVELGASKFRPFFVSRPPFSNSGRKWVLSARPRNFVSFCRLLSRRRN